MASTVSTQSPSPASDSDSIEKKKKKTFSKHLPLSEHGMPKTPGVQHGMRLHRFSSIKAPHPPTIVSPPMSPPPMSPPMSARSVGTFIDSEPSTPACSPRIGFDNSTLVLLSPMSASQPENEPRWDMVTPVPKSPMPKSPKLPSLPKSPRPDSSRPNSPMPRSPRPSVSLPRSPRPSISLPKSPRPPSSLPKSPDSLSPDSISPTHIHVAPVTMEPAPKPKPKKASLVKRISMASKEVTKGSSHQSHPVVPIIEEPQGDGASTTKKEADEKKTGEDDADQAAPLEKLASKVKFMLRRKSGGESRKEKRRREWDEFERVEEVHWTEM
ncbi:hypothetical protein BS50DRAFT_235645 [Corynespora cassiicola Philippines]|uniref:Uncharacterized protein n=1 Tax=Corynespora cassiicola Philippines TaxID=1448308 RepID=A0A2T2P279_CORCC|nr:hypothetical protein BS50DRAFT_235645 [Corynespora cassiicola Philippines]